MLEAFEQQFYMCAAFRLGRLDPFCFVEDIRVSRCALSAEDVGLRLTSLERAFPGLHVLRHLGHLDIRVEFLDLVEHSVFIVVFEIIVRLLYKYNTR